MRIQHQAVIGTINAKVDRSISYRVSTSELTSEQKAIFMDLINTAVNITIEPIDEPKAPLVKINTDLETKTPSQRLRAVLYVYFKQKNEGTDFEAFYNARMNQLIEMIKNKLED